jgi:hypothetical protein
MSAVMAFSAFSRAWEQQEHTGMAVYRTHQQPQIEMVTGPMCEYCLYEQYAWPLTLAVQLIAASTSFCHCCCNCPMNKVPHADTNKTSHQSYHATFSLAVQFTD